MTSRTVSRCPISRQWVFILNNIFLIFSSVNGEKTAYSIPQQQLRDSMKVDVPQQPLNGFFPPPGLYFKRNYTNITDEIKRLAVSPECSDILYVTSAQKLFKDRPGVNLDAEFFSCGKDQK